MTGVLARLRQKTATFLRQPPLIQAWFPAVWIILGISKGLIFTLSFRRPAPRLGRQSGIAPWVPLLTPAKERRALLIGRVVRMTARPPLGCQLFPPGHRRPRAAGALWGALCPLLRPVTRRGDPYRLKGPRTWVAAGRVRVTGGTSFGQFTVVG